MITKEESNVDHLWGSGLFHPKSVCGRYVRPINDSKPRRACKRCVFLLRLKHQQKLAKR